MDQAEDHGPVALLLERLPYHLHAAFLGAIAAEAAGNREAADRAYAAAVVPARRLLRTAGYASDANLLDPAWDEVLLEAARLAVRARRS